MKNIFSIYAALVAFGMLLGSMVTFVIIDGRFEMTPKEPINELTQEANYLKDTSLTITVRTNDAAQFRYNIVIRYKGTLNKSLLNSYYSLMYKKAFTMTACEFNKFNLAQFSSEFISHTQNEIVLIEIRNLRSDISDEQLNKYCKQ